MKRPAHLTWSKGGGPAHGQPVNGMFAYSPFTARVLTTHYGLSEFGPVVSYGPKDVMGHTWARSENGLKSYWMAQMTLLGLIRIGRKRALG